MCDFTVVSPMYADSAISVFERPRAASRYTSRSQGRQRNDCLLIGLAARCRCEVADQREGRGWCVDGVALVDGPDGSEQQLGSGVLHEEAVGARVDGVRDGFPAAGASSAR